MATDLEKLVVQLSADFKSFEKAMARAQGVTNKQFNAIERRARQMNRNLDGIFSRTFRGLTAPLAGIGAALGAREIMRLADTWTELKSRVDLAAGSLENGEVVMGRLTEMARRTYSGLEQTAESWLSNATALKELGYSTEQQLDLVETLNNALVISAAKGQRAESVMNAWSKAMALGKLSGDNLNTIIQSGGRLAEALAASMGVSTNQLRKLGQQGKITTREMYGVTSQLKKLREEADSMQATIGDAVQILKDALLAYVGAGDQAVGVSSRLAEAIIMVADNFKEIADVTLQLAFVITSALVGRALGGLISKVPAAITAVTALTAAVRAGTLTAAGFTAALGPIGLAAGALAAGLYLLATRHSEADKAAELHAAAVSTLTNEIQNVDYANKDAVESTRGKIASDIKAAEVALERAMAEQSLAQALQDVANQRASARPGGREYTGFGVDTSKVPTGGSEVVAQNIIAPQVDKTADKVELMKKRVEEIKALSAEFEDYASGRKTPPTRSGGAAPVGADDSGKKKKDRADEYERLTKRIADSTAALVGETEVQRQLNPLVEDYGFAVTKARAEQDLLNAALEAGKEITPDLRKNIADLAEQYALATVEAAKLGQTQDEIRRKAEEMQEFQKDLTRGIVDGFVQGKKAADIFAEALTKIGNKLLDMAFNGLFDMPSAGGSGFNLLKLFGFSTGGYTGPGPKNKPAGVVHAGEVVWSQDDIRKAGGVAAVEAMRKGMGGMAMPASIQAPAMPRLVTPAAGQQQIVVNFQPQIDASGADPAAIARLETGLAKVKNEIPGQVIASVRKAQKSNVKLG